MSKDKKALFSIILLLIIVLLLSCAQKSKNTVESPKDISKSEQAAAEPAKGIISPSTKIANANETGKIMILMYHTIGAEQEGDWKQTADNFRRDLLTLYQEDYYLTDLLEYVGNELQTPAGKTPIILTFDDAGSGQFRYILDKDNVKTVDPNCAVGILLDFTLEHPDFGRAATFYINAEPFGQRSYWQEKLRELNQWGFSIGNHTYSHRKLNQLSNDEVQKEIALLAKTVGETVPGYQVRSLSLPYGLFPPDRNYAASGSYENYPYMNEALLKVGAAPAVGPNTEGFNPLTLPRIQASTLELEKWLQYFRNHPEERYISDGDSSKITLPVSREKLINKNSLGHKELVIY